MRSTQIPIVDLGFGGGDAPNWVKVAEEVRTTCEDLGFLTVMGHGKQIRPVVRER